MAEEARKKAEEYDAWKAMFSVDDAGDENPEDAEDEAVLVRFIKHVMDNKVVQLEELGGEFSLRVHEIIARVGALESMGYLSGVTDDRGKFIYVSKDELQAVQAVAKFIVRKGRVRIAACGACLQSPT